MGLFTATRACRRTEAPAEVMPRMDGQHLHATFLGQRSTSGLTRRSTSPTTSRDGLDAAGNLSGGEASVYQLAGLHVVADRTRVLPSAINVRL